ncbi:MAG TPA: glycosyltransferase [Candidatus Binatia bacterium]|jgi:glycosyltransferase involved in cell wall biosynthesis|nr:glycosyltransferase [Candidatus Binatia bacterium]
MRSPIVSVVIPAYNVGCFLPETLASVFNQSYSNYEVIVVDDGSSDGTGETLRAYEGRLIYRHQQNRGPSAARNAGIRAARGNYIAFLDADDLWSRDKLKLQVDFMEQNPQIGLVFSDMEEFDHEKTLCRSLLERTLLRSEMIAGRPAVVDAERKLLVEDFIPTSTVLVRRECLTKTGLFDESLHFVEDRELWLRVAASFPIAVLPFVVGRKRVHDSNLTKKSAEQTLRARIGLWEKTRHSLSEPVTHRLLDPLLADAHLQLGYILLNKDRRREARQVGLRSIHHALKHAARKNSEPLPLPAYRWPLGIALVPLTFIKWSISRRVWRLTNHLLCPRPQAS